MNRNIISTRTYADITSAKIAMRKCSLFWPHVFDSMRLFSVRQSLDHCPAMRGYWRPTYAISSLPPSKSGGAFLCIRSCAITCFNFTFSMNKTLIIKSLRILRAGMDPSVPMKLNTSIQILRVLSFFSNALHPFAKCAELCNRRVYTCMTVYNGIEMQIRS